MRAIHVVLSLSSSLLREAIRQELGEYEDIRVVAEVSSPIELLCSTQCVQADAVIVESDVTRDMPGVLSHLFAEYPHLVAVVLDEHGGHAVVYRQQVCRHVYESVSLAEVIAELRTADTEYWARVDE